jgi:hypothetical protein
MVVEPQSTTVKVEHSMMDQLDKHKKEGLKKREPKKGEVKAEMIKPQVPIVITFDADVNLQLDRKAKVPDPTLTALHNQEIIKIPRYKFLGMSDITAEHAAVAESFLKDIDQRLCQASEDEPGKYRIDTQIILLLMAKQFLLRFFGFSEKAHLLEDHVTVLLRMHIDCASMAAALLVVKESCQGGLYLQKLSQFCDLLIMVLTNPSGFEVTSLSGLRSGKPMANVYVFFIKSVIQQINVLDSIYSRDIREIPGNSMINHEISRYAEDMISSTFNMIAFRHFRQDHSTLRKPLLLVASQITPQETLQMLETRPFNFFGLQADKFSDRERTRSLTRFFEQCAGRHRPAIFHE